MKNLVSNVLVIRKIKQVEVDIMEVYNSLQVIKTGFRLNEADKVLDIETVEKIFKAQRIVINGEIDNLKDDIENLTIALNKYVGENHE